MTMIDRLNSLFKFNDFNVVSVTIFSSYVWGYFKDSIMWKRRKKDAEMNERISIDTRKVLSSKIFIIWGRHIHVCNNNIKKINSIFRNLRHNFHLHHFYGLSYRRTTIGNGWSEKHSDGLIMRIDKEDSFIHFHFLV